MNKLEKWEEDEAWLAIALGINNPPSENDLDFFAERVAMLVCYGIDENKARIDSFKIIKRRNEFQKKTGIINLLN